METQELPQKKQPSGVTAAAPACTHQRLIEDILARGGKRTGKVRCLECNAEFNDPYQGLK